MFSSQQYLNRKTPEKGIDRREFIEHLVEEYYTTTNIEAQEQVSANLANFAYDPINWPHLKEAKALHLFVELLQSPNERLQLHASAGLCNICFDSLAHTYIINPHNLDVTLQLFLKTQNIEVLLNLATLFYQLLSGGGELQNLQNLAELKVFVATPDVLRKFKYLHQNSNDQRLKNLATVFLEDYGTRTEIVELN